MRTEQGVAATDDLTLLLVAVLAFSLFFASLAAAYVSRTSGERGQQLQEVADSLLAAVVGDPRWTEARGVILASALNDLADADLVPHAGGQPFRVTVWDLTTDARWTFRDGSAHGEQRTAATSANVLQQDVHPARITATVWES